MSPISIIIPCYNGAATIARALQSCLAQSAQSDIAQIFVVDDGSTDASASIVRTYAMRDDRIRLLQTVSNGGAARARNWAALHASTPLIAFLDADDEYLPGALAAAQAHLAQRPQDAAVRLDVEFAGFPSRLTQHADFERITAILSNTVPSSLVIRRGVYLSLGGFPMDEVFRRHGGEDGALSWVLSEVFAQSRLSDAKRVRMHYHDGIHAERFMNIQMGFTQADPVAGEQTMRASQAYLDAAAANLRQLRTLARSA
ncbi:glycosyltransferase involved in cell wall biosynthesis [Paraburkholderia bannensis]|uniref:Glycosyltransferase involved in cell wall biosynthesis n=1 Tax=Paraburkholderia bannensis TaxID=765414 RepID=A0A7W9WRM5_9BURK|nr:MULTISPECIES: glycosyltransferase family A protein [Paraburkholderia]MBB3255798.1 glycosyltransferase involved in cell wall biosynthesis [Paraburkholderia sp. WP4_3_2]MBB6100798.1 glycosyltransferase involved in cell wall biosynthesis [Paraburkholderia bannensis]